MKAFRSLFTALLLFLAAGLLTPGLVRKTARPPRLIAAAVHAPGFPTAAAPAAPTDQTDQSRRSDSALRPVTGQTALLRLFATTSPSRPYGQWIQVEGYGYCWQPTAAQDPNWQPYTDGYWAYTEAGWTWVSYEDFGWITYHYGRWTQVQDAGWVWVPDYQWAPAWVSWRQSSDANRGS